MATMNFGLLMKYRPLWHKLNVIAIDIIYIRNRLCVQSSSWDTDVKENALPTKNNEKCNADALAFDKQMISLRCHFNTHWLWTIPINTACDK